MAVARRRFRRVLGVALSAWLFACVFSASVMAQTYPSLSAAAKVEKTGKNDVAVIVAVENYAFLPAVKGAVGNANDWEVFFKKSLGVSKVHMLVDRQATREQVKRFAEMAASQAKAGGTVWFVFIGHGSPSKDGTDGLLVGVDAQQDPDSLFARGFAQQELLDALNAGKQDQTVVVVDACFSGRDNKGEALAPAQPVIPTQLQPTLAKRTVVLSAAQASEFAGALPGEDRPAFSYLLLGALRGWSATGEVKAQDALGFTQQSLRGIPGRFQQTPGIFGDQDIVLVKGAKEADPGIGDLLRGTRRNATLVDVTTSEGCDTGKVKNADTQGKCCWPGQAWGGKSCVGLPTQCPEAYVANEESQSCELPRCELGQSRAKGTTQCCWPGQVWASGRAECVGVPKCPDGTVSDGKACVTTNLEAKLKSLCDDGDADVCALLAEKRYFGAKVETNQTDAQKLATRACKKGSAFGCTLGTYFTSKRQEDLAEAQRLGCNAGIGDACANWGSRLRTGSGVPKSRERAIRVLTASCDQGNPSSCLELAWAYSASSTVIVERDNRVAALQRACDGGEPLGCTHLGLWHVKHKDPNQPDHVTARPFFEKACSAKDADGCGWLGEFYLNGWGVSADPSRGTSYYDQACRYRSSYCTTLGNIYWNGKFVTKDHPAAVRYYEKACEGGQPVGCNSAANLLNGNAEGVPPNRQKSLQLYQKSCDFNDAKGCTNTGKLLVDAPSGIPQDIPRAVKLFEKACTSNYGYACSWLGILARDGRGVAKDPERAKKYLERGCDLEPWECHQLAWSYSKADIVPKNHPEALRLYRKACDAGRMASCTEAAWLLNGRGEGIAAAPQESVQLFQKGCDGNDYLGCNELGYILYESIGVAKDSKRAFELFNRACDGGFALSCGWVGMFYERGEVVGVDQSKARSYRKRACDLGDKNSCN